MRLNRNDLLLLEALQNDAGLSQQELADLAGMSKTSCWRRLRDLEAEGVIAKNVVLLDPEKLGLDINVMVSVAMVEHTDPVRGAFESHVEGLGEVTECYSISGDWDYLLHVSSDSIASYNAFLNQEILHHPSVRSASSSFSLKRIKYTTRLPLNLASKH
jgi:Lrp/AsnC family transcriptional regulator